MCPHDDVYVNGNCRKCAHIHQARYRARGRLGVAILKAAEARGLTGAQAIALLQGIDGAIVQEYKRR